MKVRAKTSQKKGGRANRCFNFFDKHHGGEERKNPQKTRHITLRLFPLKQDTPAMMTQTDSRHRMGMMCRFSFVIGGKLLSFEITYG